MSNRRASAMNDRKTSSSVISDAAEVKVVWIYSVSTPTVAISSTSSGVAFGRPFVCDGDHSYTSSHVPSPSNGEPDASTVTAAIGSVDAGSIDEAVGTVAETGAGVAFVSGVVVAGDDRSTGLVLDVLTKPDVGGTETADVVAVVGDLGASGDAVRLSTTSS